LYESFGDWFKKQREARVSREGSRWRQKEVAERLKARLQEQGIANPRVSRSSISMMEGNRLKPSADLFDLIMVEFGVKSQDDIAELRMLASASLIGTTMEPLGKSTRQMRAVEMAIDTDQEELHNTFKRIKEQLDRVEEEGRYLKLKGGQLARTGVPHTTVRVTTFLLLLERLSSIVKGSSQSGDPNPDNHKQVLGLEAIALRLEALDVQLTKLANPSRLDDDDIHASLEEIRTEVAENRRYIENLKRSASLYEIGKVFGRSSGPDLIQRNITITRRFIDSPDNLISVLDAWDRYGGWGELHLVQSQSREWRVEFRDSFLELAEPAENQMSLAEVWAGYLHGYIEEALQVNATAIGKLPVGELGGGQLQLPSRPKPPGVKEDYWIDRVEVGKFEEAPRQTGSSVVSTSDRAAKSTVFTFRVVLKRDLARDNPKQATEAAVSGAYIADSTR
jgi:transcriptional regulator with XRE-family HTH domain